jgi:hypothetical protein
LCKDLLMVDLSTKEGMLFIRKNNLFELYSPIFVRDSALILTQVIKEMEKQESKRYFQKAANHW